MNFNKAEFLRFCNDLQVDTKEYGIVPLGKNLMGTQLYFIDEIEKALANDVHYIVCLKGRQVMVSTICLALDLYWSGKYPGVQGTLITDTDENRDMFRETLTMYMDGLPVKWKQPIMTHNRSQLTFKNRSRFMYQVAGTRKKEKRSVGVGKAVNFMHATEVSNWGDDGAMADIEASLAQKNPNRLYIFESTARGPNGYQEAWETAQNSRTQAAIFVGWWRNTFYAFEEDTPEFAVYWDGRANSDENEWVGEVKRLYDFDITPNQLAWWRWMRAEHVHEENEMLQNYPPTEDYAFVMSGSQFFTNKSLSERMKSARGNAPDCYNLNFGLAFADTEAIPAHPKNANFRIWEHPKAHANYCIGADPAWGSSEWADRFCISVWRAYADGLDQVAELCTPTMNTGQFAWALMYIAGAYFESMINLELNGPGMAVWQEIISMRRLAFANDTPLDRQVMMVVNNITNYLYRRPDSIGGSYNYHTKSTTQEKERFMNVFKEGHERGLIQVRSVECLNEMKNVVRDDGDLGAPGRGKDDRVIAAALAAIAWKDLKQVPLAYLGRTRAAGVESDITGNDVSPIARNVQDYLKKMGINLKAPAGVGMR